jgi:hypothetical protein
VLLAVLLFAPGLRVAESWAQGPAGAALAKTVVKPRAYVSLDPVPRGPFELAVVAEIAPGYHINANKVLDPYLIPTEIEPQFPAAFRILETVYPPGRLEQFPFAAYKLAVYDGRVTFRLRVEAGAEAPLGEQKLSLLLHYQVCDSTACLPPVKLPMVVSLKVVPAGAKARSVHPEIFRSQSSTRREKPS